MIESLEVSNFRAFKHLKIHNLRRINVITGANGSAKTALLESIVLGCRGIPLQVPIMNLQRGMPGITINLPHVIFGNQDQFIAHWRSIFYDLDLENKIDIKMKDSTRGKIELQISFEGDVQANKLFVNLGAGGGFLFKRIKDKNDSLFHIRVGAANEMTHEPITSHLGPVSVIFGSHVIHAEADIVTWFSILSSLSQESRVVKAVQTYFPEIKELSILSISNIQAVWATLNERKLPVSLVSSGLHKFLTLVLASVAIENGVIIIDEIENGIYYNNYSIVWDMLYRFNNDNHNQVFATCHSLECLRALAPVVEGHKDDFCLLRAERKDNDIAIRQVVGEALQAAISGNVEVR